MTTTARTMRFATAPLLSLGIATAAFQPAFNERRDTCPRGGAVALGDQGIDGG